MIESGAIDAEVSSWLVAGFARWLKPGEELNLLACLRLPPKRAAVLARMRDAWLRAAADEIPAGGPWTKAKQLRAALCRFEGTAWPIWRKYPLPPAHASRFEAAIYFALRTGATLPSTVQMLRNILGNPPK